MPTGRCDNCGHSVEDATKDVTVNREEVVKEIKGENVLSSASGVN